MKHAILGEGRREGDRSVYMFGPVKEDNKDEDGEEEEDVEEEEPEEGQVEEDSSSSEE